MKELDMTPIFQWAKMKFINDHGHNGYYVFVKQLNAMLEPMSREYAIYAYDKKEQYKPNFGWVWTS